MEKHIEFDDIVKYITCAELSREKVALAQRVNSHLLGCEECRRKYEIVNRFYDVAYNDNLDSDLFNSIENVKMLVRFKVEQGINLFVENLSHCLYQYDNPILVGTRDLEKTNQVDRSWLVDEENSLNSIRMEDDLCIMEIDKEEWDGKEPIILIINKDNELVVCDEMKDAGDIYQLRIPLSNSGYKVYITS